MYGLQFAKDPPCYINNETIASFPSSDRVYYVIETSPMNSDPMITIKGWYEPS